MSMRFTDKRKWQEPWFRTLAPEEKLAFFYAWENCDNAGFIPYDDQAVTFYTGIAVKRVPKLWEKLIDRIVIKGEWMWIKEFPLLQKNWPPNPTNNAHKQIIRLLGERYEHFKDSSAFTIFIEPVKGLLCHSGMGNGNGSSLGINKGLGNGNGQGLSSGRELEPKESGAKAAMEEKRTTILS